MNKLNLNEEIFRIKEMMFFNEENIKHIYQPSGNSCGPTCIKMVGDFIMGNVGEIDDICKTCGTDWVVGTPPDRMKIGLDKLNIKFVEHISEVEPFQSIRNVIDKGNVAIVRTFTHKVPHWIVINDYENDVFTVNDPWLGKIEYNEQQLDEIWKERNYFYYEIITKEIKTPQNINVRPLEEKDIKIIYNNLSDVFNKTNLSNKTIWGMLTHYNPSMSFVATVNDEVAGFYFIGNDEIPNGNEDKRFKGLKPAEGIALGIFKKYKNLGIGKKLIQKSQQLPVDYIWGYQLKSLKNIDDWLKRRKIYYESDSLYITYQMLGNNQK